jgi:hypothetical protein
LDSVAGDGLATRDSEAARRRHLLALVVLFALAAAHWAWNARSLASLLGYDVGGHAGYLYSVAMEGRLPHPLEGWSTFHPPAYYLVAGAVWRLVEPMGPEALRIGLRAASGLGWLVVGAVAAWTLRCQGVSRPVTLVATALVLFVPCSQMAAAMLGNEALAAGLAALVIPPVLRLHADPRDLRAAALLGLCAGLALLAKFTGVFVAVGALLPFLRLDFDRRMAVSLAVCVSVAAVLLVPVYGRNLLLTGTPIPMTRELEPMRSFERVLELRDRRVADYLWLDPGSISHPGDFLISPPPEKTLYQNEAMTNVPGLALASAWFDPHGARFSHWHQWRGSRAMRLGTALVLLGLLPTALVGVGFAAALAAAARSRGRASDAPLTLMAAMGLASFVAFSWGAPSMAAVKASYLLPLAVPAAVFFARACGLVGRRARRILLVISATAALASAVVFTEGVVLESRELDAEMVEGWRLIARRLDSEPIRQAVKALTGS